MRKIKIIGQVIALITTLLIGGIILLTKIPGYGAICDAGQMYLVYLYLLFFFIIILLLANSKYHYEKDNWKEYRLFVMRFSFLLIFLIFSLRSIYTLLYFGFTEYKIRNSKSNKGANIYMELYKKGDFFVYTYDCSCETESLGTYNISNKVLKLKFNKEKPIYLDTIYKIENNELTCENLYNEVLVFSKN